MSSSLSKSSSPVSPTLTPDSKMSSGHTLLWGKLVLFLRTLFNGQSRKDKIKPPATLPDEIVRLKAAFDVLVSTAPARDLKSFRRERDSFLRRYARFKLKDELPKWSNIQVPDTHHILSYDELPKTEGDRSLLVKLAVLKLNGGLETSMGITGAKSALQVKDGSTFLDLIVKQMKYLNESNHVDVPLLLLNSFNTEADTKRILSTHANSGVQIQTFSQSRFPRIFKDTHLPCPTAYNSDGSLWYPPGHGELYDALSRSGMLDKLLSQGKEYLFVSNVDNPGATIDERILQYMHGSEVEFIMEVADKTKADLKSGTLVQYDGSLALLEIAQVPKEHINDFKSVHHFKVFNTNNLWINLKALKRLVVQDKLDLDIIANYQTSPDGRGILQLESAAGAAIRHFQTARAIKVPRSRFIPVKHTSDLLLLKSDLYSFVPDSGLLLLSPEREFETVPTVTLSHHFAGIEDFQGRFGGIPKMGELDHLTVSGDVWFGRDVTLKGTVIVVAKEGQRIDIPDGCVLENKMLTGDIAMTKL